MEWIYERLSWIPKNLLKDSADTATDRLQRGLVFPRPSLQMSGLWSIVRASRRLNSGRYKVRGCTVWHPYALAGELVHAEELGPRLGPGLALRNKRRRLLARQVNAVIQVTKPRHAERTLRSHAVELFLK
jgi:hypothetical protein